MIFQRSDNCEIGKARILEQRVLQFKEEISIYFFFLKYMRRVRKFWRTRILEAETHGSSALFWYYAAVTPIGPAYRLGTFSVEIHGENFSAEYLMILIF
jgi:hypothetical protein